RLCVSKAKRIVIMSDVQAPYEDRKLVKAFTRFIKEYVPDELVNIGDLADFPQPSRWNKNTRGEYAEDIYRDSEYIKAKILGPLREAYDGPIGVLEGNHDLRPRQYLAEYAPALDGGWAADNFRFENPSDFKSFGIEKLPDFYEFAPEAVITRGDLGGIRMSQEAGRTALNGAKEKCGKSVIMGHTPRLGKASKSHGYDQKIVRTITEVEVGNMMDMRQAGYLKGAAGNWQKGFAIAYVDRRHVQVDLIEVSNRRFTVEGVTYRV